MNAPAEYALGSTHATVGTFKRAEVASHLQPVGHIPAVGLQAYHNHIRTRRDRTLHPPLHALGGQTHRSRPVTGTTATRDPSGQHLTRRPAPRRARVPHHVPRRVRRHTPHHPPPPPPPPPSPGPPSPCPSIIAAASTHKKVIIGSGRFIPPIIGPSHPLKPPPPRLRFSAPPPFSLPSFPPRPPAHPSRRSRRGRLLVARPQHIIQLVKPRPNPIPIIPVHHSHPRHPPPAASRGPRCCGLAFSPRSFSPRSVNSFRRSTPAATVISSVVQHHPRPAPWPHQQRIRKVDVDLRRQQRPTHLLQPRILRQLHHQHIRLAKGQLVFAPAAAASGPRCS